MSISYGFLFKDCWAQPSEGKSTSAFSTLFLIQPLRETGNRIEMWICVNQKLYYIADFYSIKSLHIA